LGVVVATTESAVTCIDTRTRPEDEWAPTVHGRDGRVAKSMGGTAPPGFAVPTVWPLTTNTTDKVDPLMRPTSFGPLGVGAMWAQADATIATAARSIERLIFTAT
jgi:hypothetical protein